MAEFSRWGMTMRTSAGPVDLVPLYRRLDGDMEVRVVDDERDAAVLALTHLGTPINHIVRALHMTHRDARAVLARCDMEPILPAESFSWMAVVYTSNTQRRQQRKAERELIDGRLVHQGAPHGTDFGYTDFGCQCAPCSAAHAAKLAAHRKAVARV